MKWLNTLHKLDWYLVIPAVYLVAIGLVIQHSILFKTTGGDAFFTLEAQITSIGVGLLAVVYFALRPFSFWRNLAPWFYWTMVTLLGLVVLIGTSGGGAERWIRLGPFQLQPSETAKLASILILARMFDNRSAAVNRVKTVVLSIIVVGLPTLLTAVQPDLGSALVFVFIWLGIVFASKMRLNRIAIIAIAVVGVTIMTVPFLADYQQQRLVSYFNPNSDTQGGNYNTIQAGIAIGSGGISGNGLDSGSQSQLNFLPSQHTDFVFAVVGEKLGLIGTGSIVVAIAALTTRMMIIARRLQAPFERAIVVGVASLLFFHSAINIGMNLGLLPVTGLPLPLISYGGTFMFTMILAVGWTVVISYRHEQSAKHL